MTERLRMVRKVSFGAALLVLGGLAACADHMTASAESRPAPASPARELTPLQAQLLVRPVSPEAAAGRPATRADLEAVRGWFGPGELEALLVVANRGARASGADTLPHCLPLCDPAEPTSR